MRYALLASISFAVSSTIACSQNHDGALSSEDNLTAPPSQGTTTNAKFEEISCREFPAVIDTAARAGVTIEEAISRLGPARCGYMNVPESHAKPNGPRVRLATVVAKATEPGPDKSPLLYISGGPGESAMFMIMGVVSGSTYADLRRERDMVIVNDRGVHYSEPTLKCSELDELPKGIFGADDKVHPVTLEDTKRALAGCYRRLTKDVGIDLATYNTREMADDLNDALNVLGYTHKTHVFGISFGTRRVQQFAKLFPNRVASIMVDSPSATEDNFAIAVARSSDEVIRSVLGACAADTGCNARHPNIVTEFYRVIAEIEANRPAITVVDPATNKVFPWNLTGKSVYMTLAFSFMDDRNLARLPSRFEKLKAGDYADITKDVAGALVPGPDTNAGAYLSVACSEANHATEDMLPRDIHPLVGPFIRETVMETTLGKCAVWPVPKITDIDKDAFVPLKSATLPALVLAAKFDSNTRSAHGALVASHLAASHFRMFPDRGHVTTNKSCGLPMLLGFLKDPTKAPDNTCLDGLAVPWE